jgi:hypothetical protein
MNVETHLSSIVTSSPRAQMSLNVNHCHKKDYPMFRREKTFSIATEQEAVFH